MHLLLADSYNFHKRNFSALFSAMTELNARWTIQKDRRSWWERHGDYRGFETVLEPYLAKLPDQPEALADFTYHQVRLWDCARSELLCFLLPKPHWRNAVLINRDEDILPLILAHEEDLAALRNCLAAAMSWLDYWRDVLQRKGPFSHVLVFSGSYIYTCALQELAKRQGIRGFTLESFFTGNEFYFEERYTPLPNQSLLRLSERRERVLEQLPAEQWEALRFQAHRRLMAMRNKNVKPVEGPTPRLHAPGTERVVLVIGQVLNDYSLLETRGTALTSLGFYEGLIAGLLQLQDVCVVFKAHPWERKRANLRRPLTLEHLQLFREKLPEGDQQRLHLLEELPIKELFHQADYVVGICSQGMLEACQAGFKPIETGKAFFGGAGFTWDATSVDEVVTLIRDGKSGRLSLAEYDCFERFLTFALCLHLVSNDPGGCERVKRWLRDDDEKFLAEDGLGRLWTQPTVSLSLVLEIVRNPLPWIRDLLRLLSPGRAD